MIRLTPALLVATANALCHVPNNMHAPASLVELFVNGVMPQPFDRWDAAFVHHAGFWSHYDNRTGTSSWPLPATAITNDLGLYAADQRVLSDEAPEPGELFLLWSPSQSAFVRTGIVVAVEPPVERYDGALEYECNTIEANVTGTGRLDGPGLGCGARLLCPTAGDRTIRWSDLEEHELTMRRLAAAGASGATPERDVCRREAA